jgi:hypothetical protein
MGVMAPEERERQAAREAAAGLKVEGRIPTQGTSSRPAGTVDMTQDVFLRDGNRPHEPAVDKVIAGLYAEEAARTGDPEALEIAQNFMAEAGELGEEIPEDILDSARRSARAPAPLLPSPGTRERAPALPRRTDPVQVDETQEEPGPLLVNELPEDIMALLEEDDDEQEPETHGRAVVEDDLDDEEDEEDEFGAADYDDSDELEFVDPRAAKLARENAELKKKIETRERADRKTQRAHWLKQDAPHFQSVPAKRAVELAKASTSRKEFVKRMKAVDEELHDHVEALVRARLGDVDSERERARAEAQGEVREAWGEPVTPAIVTDTRGLDTDRALAIAKERGGLDGFFAEMIRRGRGPR